MNAFFDFLISYERWLLKKEFLSIDPGINPITDYYGSEGPKGVYIGLYTKWLPWHFGARVWSLRYWFATNNFYVFDESFAFIIGGWSIDVGEWCQEKR